MPERRLVRVLSVLSAGSDPGPRRLCTAAAEVVELSGAGIMLMSGDIRRGSICSSDAVTARIEDLQYTLGEGPCVDAYHQDRPVLEPDLAHGEGARWPAFTPPAVAAGARAVFGFPMEVGAIRLGALNLYRDRSGDLSDDQHADAIVMAGVAARSVLAMQAEAPPGGLAAEIEAGSDLHFVVHQATGMVAEQLEVGVAEAMIRLRAYAFANDRPLGDVADDVVCLRLRLD